MKNTRMSVGLMVMASLTVALVAGCEDGRFLTRQQDVDRANLPEQALPGAGEKAQAPEDNGLTTTKSGDVSIKPPVEEITGTYQFTTPTSVTRIDKVKGDYEQYLLYWGRPAEGDTPFLVLTVGPKIEASSEQADSNLKAENNRIYRLNGLIAKEWTGYTADKKLPFCELVVSHPGKGNECHAVAVVKNDAQRKVALEVLGSLTWQVNP